VKTILVTGASGFIGRRLVTRLRDGGEARVLALERTPSAQTQTDRLSVALEALDRDYWKRLGIGAIEVIFHFGAYIPKNATSADLVQPIVASNVQGTAALLASLPNTPDRFIFASSVDVYRRVDGRKIDEASEVGPTTLYGASKFFGEELVRSYARSTGSSYSILRLGHIFGPGEERFQRVIPSLIRAMLSRRQPQLSGDGATERDYLYVDDAVDAVVAASALRERIHPLNVVRGESISILDLAKLIADLTGYEGRFSFSGSNGDSLRFDNGEMLRELGVRSFVSLREGLAREIAHFRDVEFAAR
jgi:nucleoside-diphosphate-sugar epimerase